MVSLGLNRPSTILHTLTESGLQSKKGNKLTLHVFLKMLRNPVYIGEMKSKKWGTRKGLHKPLISEHAFRNVQRILSGKAPIAAPYERNREDFPLRRFLRCSECDTPLTGGPSKSASGKKYDYYHCYRCRAVKSLSTHKATAGFLELLKRLRPSEAFTAEFSVILKEEWSKRTVSTSTQVRKLNMDLTEKRKTQQKLLLKYLNDDPAIVPHFVHLNQRFDEEIAALEAQIAYADAEKATFEQIWQFSKSLLIDIPTAWERAGLDQKQRVQNVLFPTGLKYHPQKGILNSENDCLFNELEGFVSGKMSLVRPERFELPT